LEEDHCRSCRRGFGQGARIDQAKGLVVD